MLTLGSLALQHMLLYKEYRMYKNFMLFKSCPLHICGGCLSFLHVLAHNSLLQENVSFPLVSIESWRGSGRRECGIVGNNVIR